MFGLDPAISEGSFNPQRSDALGRLASMHIATVDVVSRQIAVGVGRPGEIDRAGSRIGHRDQPLGNSRRKGVFGRNRDRLARRSLHLHRLPGKRQCCDSFDHIAVLLVEEGGGIDRMTRVCAVRAVDRERLCSRRRGRGERRAAHLVRGRGVQLLAFNTEEYRSSGVCDRSPAEQDTITSHLASQPGEV